jgi:ABC-type glycerol-3-phosphate transport system substrate-binding protein
MKRAILPLVLAFAASAAFACPGGDKSADAKAHSSATVSSAQPTAAQQSKAEADKKLVKKVEAKKTT